MLDVRWSRKNVELKDFSCWSLEDGCRRSLPIEWLVVLLVTGNECIWCTFMRSDNNDRRKAVELYRSMDLWKHIRNELAPHSVKLRVGCELLVHLEEVRLFINWFTLL